MMIKVLEYEKNKLTRRACIKTNHKMKETDRTIELLFILEIFFVTIVYIQNAITQAGYSQINLD